MVRVNGACIRIVCGATERVLVEAFLGDGAIGAVLEVCAVADEVFQMTLVLISGPKEQGLVDQKGIWFIG